MRYKITLEVVPEAYGSVLPISYQYELSRVVADMIQADKPAYDQWLAANGFTPEEAQQVPLYSVSNLYIPKIYVMNDRLQIKVPRIQFWISLFPEQGTGELLKAELLNRQLTLGDATSRVLFNVKAIEEVSPISYELSMRYQSLSPIVVEAIRPNGTLEYLTPSNNYFAEFGVQGLIERWEFLHHAPYEGDRRFSLQIIAPERRKSVLVSSVGSRPHKIFGYMLKFRLVLDPQLQEVAYVCGLGDNIDKGFGYLELMDKTSR